MALENNSQEINLTRFCAFILHEISLDGIIYYVSEFNLISNHHWMMIKFVFLKPLNNIII